MTQTAAPPAAPDSKDTLLSRLHRLTVDQYEAMIQHGIIAEDDDVELIDGWIVEKMGKNEAHVLVSILIQAVFPALLPVGWLLSTENPARIEDSLPEPDVCFLRGRPRDYQGRRIQAADIGIIIEISDTTLDQDRAVKLDLYARGAVPIYWIINVGARQIEVYSQPATNTDGTGRYQTRIVYAAADTIPFTLDGVTIAQIPAADLLP